MASYKSLYKQSHALLVAVDEYQNMSKLSTAVYGAEAFAELLSTTFEFQITKFFNNDATERKIVDWCRNLKCDVDDQVIYNILFCGSWYYSKKWFCRNRLFGIA